MKYLNREYMNPFFSHIYIEKRVRNHPRTQNILLKFPNAEIIEIQNYKEIFCRKRQNIALQNEFPKLILAEKKEHLIYHGSPVCQNFGEEYFYYTSCVMNCFYNCTYCYLKGMYLSGNIVIFVNLEDIFFEVEKILRKHKMYLCISYDTDLMSLESITGFLNEWSNFVSEKNNIVVECRTKCGRTDLWKKMKPSNHMIFAFTLSPQIIIEKYELRTSSLEERISCIQSAINQGFPVRLCFDPMIYIPDWKKHYENLIQKVIENIDLYNIKDISIGSFRISKDYLKNLRRALPDSAVVQYPFENEHGFYHYPSHLMKEMEQYLTDNLKKYISEDKIFHWKL